MTRSESAHRPEFTVRCACGIAYHTNNTHVGRELPCKCGRKVKIERAAEERRPVDAVLPRDIKGHRRRGQSREAHSADNGWRTTQSETARETRNEAKREPEAEIKPARKMRRSRASSKSASAYATYVRSQGWRRRLSVALANSLRPLFYGSRVVRTAGILAWGYLAGMIFLWAALYYTSERSLPGTMIAYGPRWLALAPLALLVPLAALAARATLFPLLLAAWLCVFPIMGTRFSFTGLSSRNFPATPAAETFRVVSFNADGSARLANDVREMLRKLAPDVVTFQECSDAVWDSLQVQSGWHTARYGSLCTGSRWAIVDIEQMPREDFVRMSARGFGGTALVMRTLLATPHGSLLFVNLHLETARKGLESILGDEGLLPDHPLSRDGLRNFRAGWLESGRGTRFTSNASIRKAESERASRWVMRGAAHIPVMVAGDFNMPVESTIFGEYWSHLTDAFEAKGYGLGWSKHEGRWLRVRIDHILSSDLAPKPIRVTLGPDYFSDHLPVIADFKWPEAMKAQH